MRQVFFLTSNRAKLMHAKHLASEFAIDVRGRRQYGRAYIEPRTNERSSLLDASYRDALRRWNKDSPHDDTSFFFFEDTSVVIDALSREEEVPGLDVKYWMQDMTFDRLDGLLRESGNNRSVTVRSDVVLHIPSRFRAIFTTSDEYIVFTSVTKGSVARRDSRVGTNLLYPWLDSRSFNKWFVPSGKRLPLSEMPIDVADQFDIRRGSIGAMFKLLHKLGFIKRKEPSVRKDIQTLLPSFIAPVLLVCGLPCVGKTTLGEFLSEHHGYFHIEASDYMKREFYERHGHNSGLSIHDFADKALVKTPEIVVMPVLHEVESSGVGAAVITGFRSPLEIEIFLNEYRGEAPVVTWYLECKPSIRFHRSVTRKRKDAAASSEEFEARDELQLRMGLSLIRDKCADLTLRNERTKREFMSRAAKLLEVAKYRHWEPEPVEVPKVRPTSLEEAILIMMASRSDASAVSTTEIARLLNETFPGGGASTNKNNVSRYFNFRYSAYYSLESSEGVSKFTLSATGRSRAMQLLGRVRGPFSAMKQTPST